MNAKYEKMLLPWVGKASKFGSFFLSDVFRLHDIDLTKEQFILLMKLHGQDGRPQHTLAFITDRDKTSLTRLITTLEKKGLVKRSVSKEDKRSNLVFLTEQGRLLVMRTIPLGWEALNKVQEGISEEEIDITLTVLKKMIKNIQIQKDKYRCGEEKG